MTKTINPIYLIETEITPYAAELDAGGKPENYLVVISEGDDLIDISNAKELCKLAGGPGQDSKEDFAGGNASDLFIIPQEENAPGHGDTPRDVRTVQETINWLEKSMDIKEHYKIDELEFNTSKNIMYFCLYGATIGFYLLLIPLYLLIRNRILKYN